MLFRAMIVSKVLISLLLFPVVVNANPDDLKIVISTEIELPFTPKNIVFLLSDSEGVIGKVGGVSLKLGEGEQHQGHNSRYLVGTEISHTPKIDSYSIIIFGEDDAYDFVPSQQIDPMQVDLVYNSIDNLRELVVRKRQTLIARKSELAEETMNLKKLRIDAADMTDIGRIIELEEETKRIQSASIALEGDIETLRQALQNVKLLPPPNKFEPRKSQLTTQLAEMAQAALQAEQGALRRKSSGLTDIDSKLAVIDSTRFDDLEDLEREYNLLTGKDVEELESSALPVDTNNLPLQSADYFNLTD